MRPDSPAAEAGVKAGDVIARVRGESVQRTQAYRFYALVHCEIGEAIRIEMSDGRVFELVSVAWVWER